ncbi:MAG: asparagine synthase (glutamine-hydrolyzing) [Candidatus Aenigmatarchaeota archaeon]|nr:MAG: asparagine synthase (glutamine-hydrolyzing) [Candidatus Aenigmarchaeota archaeon]
MCGFAAFFEPGRLFSPELLKGADRDLYHRGPDSEGNVNERGFSLVFRRLSIIDLSDDADQPMSDSTGRCSIVFNGEIYNYKELRKELQSLGAIFNTHSDTEVILQGYLFFGEKILDRLEGMYAFAIVDRKEDRAIVARDPYGIKPLYMLREGLTTAFASEMRVLTRLVEPEIDQSALAELLIFGWAAGTKSNLKGIERVLGGTLYRICLKTGRMTSRRFFNVLDLVRCEVSLSREEAIEVVSHNFEKSVDAHLMSDVGYALQLSGGVDSSLVAAFASNHTDWTISSFAVSLGDHPLDEAQYRKEVIERYNLNHHEIPLGNREFADAFERAVWHMEGPVPHLGCVMIMLICDQIKPFTKVVLTGEGADEMFGGYERYALWNKLRLQELFSKYIPSKLIPNKPPFMGIKKFADRDAAVYASVYHDLHSLHKMFPELVPGPGAREIASRRFKPFLHRLFAVDQTAYLESLLVRQDKMSMAASVEARVPYVHLPLAKILNSIPRKIMATGKITKPVLKSVAEKYLSRELIYRRKNGLLLPYSEWLKDPEGLGRYLEYLTDPNCRLAKYGYRGVLNEVVERFRGGREKEMPWIMNLINVEIWLRTSDFLARQN